MRTNWQQYCLQFVIVYSLFINGDAGTPLSRGEVGGGKMGEGQKMHFRFATGIFLIFSC